MLLGMGLLALPVIAHLLNRRARRRLVFPTIVLLTESSASQSQLFKLRRWLLLALRCLAVALIVLAFSRPVWHQSAAATATLDKGAAVVFIVDLSASTGQQADGVSAIQSLRAEGSRALRELLLGSDAANIVYASARPDAAFPGLAPNLQLVQQQIETLKPTFERADFAGAIARAGQLLAERTGSRRLVILTDFQQSNWHDIEARLSTDKPLPEDTAVTIVPLATAVPDNVGLSQPKLAPHTPLVNQPATLLIKATNHSPGERTTRIDVTIDGKQADSQAVQLVSGEQREVPFSVRFESPGDHRVVFSIAPDGLEADNQCYLIARVSQRIPIVVIGDDHPDEPGTGTYFMTRALAPHGTMSDRYEVRHLTSADVSTRHLQDAAAVFVGYVGPMPQRVLPILHDYMQRGGGVAVFCGDGPVAQNLAALDALNKDGVLPWRPVAMNHLAARGDMMTVGEAAWRNPLWRDFDESSQDALKRIRFGRVWSTDLPVPQAQVLMSFNDGTPALGSRSVGLGKCVLANFSPALSDSDLGKYGSFVALMHSLTRHLQSEVARRRDTTVGEALHLTATEALQAGEMSYMLIGPDDQRLDDAEFTRSTDMLAVSLPRTRLPGFYRVLQGDREVGVMAANVDERESDLRRIDADVIRQQLSAYASAVTVHQSTEEQPMLELRGRPVWGWLLALAMTALAIELALLAYWRR